MSHHRISNPSSHESSPGSGGCAEYEALSRRGFLGLSSGALLAAIGAPAWLPSVTYARDFRSNRDVIVSLYLRGGVDGMSVVVPFLEAQYYAKRPTIALAPPDSGGPSAVIDLDGQFGFAPAMAPLMDAYDAGHLAILQATGSSDSSRSHFEAQHFMEIGKPGDEVLVSGWLGRHLAGTSPVKDGAVLRGVSLAAGMARTLAGAPATLPIPRLAEFGISGDPLTAVKRLAAIDAMHDATSDPLRAVNNGTQATIGLLRTINFGGYQPSGGAVYPATSLGTAFKSTAALIKADVGVEAVAIDMTGWDTHAGQGPANGTMAQLMDNLAKALGAFHADIESSSHRVTTVVMSEFGRNLEENSGLGTDHGRGTIMFAMGRFISGGRVVSNWPGLNDLEDDRDLRVTIDYRDILAEIVSKRLGNQNLASVFPGFTPTFRGIAMA